MNYTPTCCTFLCNKRNKKLIINTYHVFTQQEGEDIVISLYCA